jgi:transcriptional regulator with XRE-family HTH domain
MSINAFGKEARKLRIDHDLLLKDVADRLRVTPTFLSAVEAGRKPIPPGFVARVADAMGLQTDERERLQKAADQSAREQRITFTSGDSMIARETVSMLARNYETLTEDDFKEIRAVMERRKM